VAEHVIADPYAAVCMSYLGDCDEYTVTHCADVAILMAAIGALLGLPEEELALLAWAGMVHDVGKPRISREVLEKPGRLTPAERTEVRRHPELGVEILRAAPECPASVLSVILQHHERLNGSGYPYGLSCEELHPHSRIAAVADTFDAMTAERVYKPPSPAREVLVYLACESDRCFDRNATTALAKLIGVYPIGTRVVLSTGERGVVVAPNPADSLRPSVRIHADRNGRRLVQPFILDLRGAGSYVAGLVA
jgi:putative nucleotidyltransferase with HDIG domain